MYVVLKKGETLAITGAATIKPSAEVSLKPASLDDIPAKMYKVGKDIPAGRYALIGTSGIISLYAVNDPYGYEIAGQRTGKTTGISPIYVMGTQHQNGDFYNYTLDSSTYAAWGEKNGSIVETYNDLYKKVNGKFTMESDGYTRSEYDKALEYAKSKSYVEAQDGQYLLVSRDSRAKRVK